MVTFEAFDVVARELMLEQRVKASELHKRLRNITEDASRNLLPVEVLYCASYGGYGYSKEFKSFIEEKTIRDSLATLCSLESGPDSDSFGCFIEFSHKDRVRHVQWLAPFGQDIMDKWPGIVQLVQAYTRNDLGNKMKLIQRMRWEEYHLHEVLKIREAIATETGEIDGQTEYHFVSLTGEDDFKVFAPSALEAMRKECDLTQTESTLAIGKYRDALHTHLTKAQISAMVKFAEENVKEQLGPELDWSQYGERKKLSFIEAIAKYGEHHDALWWCQTTFNEEAMRFLRLHPEHTEQLASQVRDNVDCAKEIGLCAAGTQYCNLEIAEVPRMAEWAVGEYDGLESVGLV